MTDETDGWGQHKLLVLEAIERLHEEVKETRAELHKLDVRLARLDVRAGLLGAVAGALPGLVVAIFVWLKYAISGKP